MKHIKLFESFKSLTRSAGASQPYKAVAYYGENTMAVGVFPSKEAQSIFSRIRSKMGVDSDTQSVEIMDLPENHDLVVCPFGGANYAPASTTNLETYKSYNGSFPRDIVQLGKDYDWDYDYDTESGQAVFKVDRNLDGFVLVNWAGGTHLIPKDKMLDYVS